MNLTIYKPLAFIAGATAAMIFTLSMTPSRQVGRTITIIEVAPASSAGSTAMDVRQLPTVYVNGRRSLAPVDEKLASAQISCFGGRC
ncbi:hypothetical protein [Roseateles amylovorans]|uniref:TonB-dependent receptor plug domain-containing protein n=1 Tax=Roseateles amylovorans TaxID=2978473 RepID=A0ABY6AYA5_9BURK|nr:hypothetical protein [Roseateles amylovorans]UXH78166.1 hypothetical protein N4261_24980 [Roseateles amylovorans]